MLAAAVAFTVAALLSAGFVFVPPMRRMLLRSAVGARWRLDAVPVSGGIAIGVGFFAGAWASLDAPVVGAVALAGGIGLAWGLLDDVATLKPPAKVAGHVVAGLALVAAGVRLPVGGGALVETTVTVAWVVVVANAVNLLDGMDGAAAGVGTVIAAAVWWWWVSGDAGLPAVAPAAVVGALGGFLVFNVRPARLFMGDSGATWLGVTLAGLSAADAGRLGGSEPAGLLVVLAVPAVLLAVPLFDTALVTVERRRHRRPLTQGGLDHTSHRLVAGGLAPAGAVAVLWSFAAVSAAAATALRLGVGAFVAAVVLLLGGLALLARRVVRVEVYE